jgi:hypothetical protein
MKRKLSWKPVKRGSIYCSSACGRGCTSAEYDLAVKKAAALAKRMGKGWKPRVWENLGWHYMVRNGIFEITVPSFNGDRYIAWVQSYPQFIVHCKDPRKGLRQAIKDFDAWIAAIQKQRAKLVEPF